MEIDKLIKTLRDEAKNRANDIDSPVDQRFVLLSEAADVLEREIKLADDLHAALHHAMECSDIDCIDADSVCHTWEMSRMPFKDRT